MAFAVVFSRSAQRHALIQRAVIADFGGFPDHNAHPVIDKQALADLCAGVNFNPGFVPGVLRNPAWAMNFILCR